MTPCPATWCSRSTDLRTHFELGEPRRQVGRRRELQRQARSRRWRSSARVRVRQVGHQPLASCACCRRRDASSAARILYRDRDGQVLDLATLPEKQMRAIRGREIAMIFQEPMTSLNPLYTVGDQIIEMITPARERVGRRGARSAPGGCWNSSRSPRRSGRIDDYPHQMSGGMRQRVMIALALVLQSLAADRRRADDRSRRDDPGADPGPGAHGCSARSG